MENRDKSLIEIRPALDLDAASSKREQFQNNTLRPILKFQNDLILQVCRHQFIKRKNVFFGLEEEQQLDYIESQVNRDNQFKQLLFGLVIGQFTLEELRFFQEEEAALRKRITALLIQRIQNQRSKII